MCQARTCGRVRARVRVQVPQNSESQMVVLRFTTLSARDRHWRNPRKKNYRESSNIKSARVSALTGSVSRKMAKTRQSVLAKWPNRCRAFQHSSGIEPKSPHPLRPVSITKPLDRINNWGNKGTWIVVFCHLQPIFLRIGPSYSDFSSWISRPDSKYENSCAKAFDLYIISHST